MLRLWPSKSTISIASVLIKRSQFVIYNLDYRQELHATVKAFGQVRSDAEKIFFDLSPEKLADVEYGTFSWTDFNLHLYRTNLGLLKQSEHVSALMDGKTFFKEFDKLAAAWTTSPFIQHDECK